MTIQAGKGDSVRARAILRSLISLEDLAKILSLRFAIPNLMLDTGSDDDEEGCNFIVLSALCGVLFLLFGFLLI